MGRHREAELLPQAGGGAVTGHSFAGSPHQCRATQPHHSTVRPDAHNYATLLKRTRLFLLLSSPEGVHSLQGIN